MTPPVEKEYTFKQMLKENEVAFARFEQLSSDFFSTIAKLKVEKLALNSQIDKLNQTIREQDEQISILKERLRKQENIEKKQEIQKESIKIVAQNIGKSPEVAELKQTIADLIKEIDETVAMLEEQ